MKKTITISVMLTILILAVVAMTNCHKVEKAPIREQTTTTETTTETTTAETTETPETTILTTKAIKYTTTAKTAYNGYTPREFKRDGVISYNGWIFTWYSENVLPGRGLKIDGRHSDGDFVRDGEGYIVLASVNLQKGEIIDTPFGEGKVYDTGDFSSGVIDIYTSF